jgi:hypothetical protein
VNAWFDITQFVEARRGPVLGTRWSCCARRRPRRNRASRGAHGGSNEGKVTAFRRNLPVHPGFLKGRLTTLLGRSRGPPRRSVEGQEETAAELMLAVCRGSVAPLAGSRRNAARARRTGVRPRPWRSARRPLHARSRSRRSWRPSDQFVGAGQQDRRYVEAEIAVEISRGEW